MDCGDSCDGGPRSHHPCTDPVAHVPGNVQRLPWLHKLHQDLGCAVPLLLLAARLLSAAGLCVICPNLRRIVYAVLHCRTSLVMAYLPQHCVLERVGKDPGEPLWPRHRGYLLGGLSYSLSSSDGGHTGGLGHSTLGLDAG